MTAEEVVARFKERVGGVRKDHRALKQDEAVEVIAYISAAVGTVLRAYSDELTTLRGDVAGIEERMQEMAAHLHELHEATLELQAERRLREGETT